MRCSRGFRDAIAVLVLILTIGLAAPSTRAQGTLEARYTASLAGVPIGKGAASVETSDGQYSAKADGRVIGLLHLMGRGGEGTVSARGRLVRGNVHPAAYAQRVHDARRDSQLHMTFASGAVAELVSDPVIKLGPDRVPLTEAHRRGVVDPMSATLMVVGGTGDPLSPEACRRTIRIFDGQTRFDLALSFKRMEQARGESGYRGPILVCRVAYQPIAGHNPTRFAVKFLMERQDIEIALAPIAGTRVLVPYRLSVPTWYGTAVLQATQFATTISASQPVPASDTSVR